MMNDLTSLKKLEQISINIALKNKNKKLILKNKKLI
jgi:hypothetical protein